MLNRTTQMSMPVGISAVARWPRCRSGSVLGAAACLAALLQAPLLAPADAVADVVLTEVIPNVTTTATRGDIVELYNRGPGDVDLTDWVLTDMDDDPIAGVPQDPTFAPGGLAVGLLGEGEFAVIEFIDDTGTASWQPTNYGLRIVAPLSPGSFLGSERDELLLLDDANTPADFVAWADTGSAVGADGREDLAAMTGPTADYGITPGDAAWAGADAIVTDPDYYATAVDFSAFATVSTFGGGAIRRISTGGTFDVGAPDGVAQWEAVDRHLARLGNPSDTIPTMNGIRPILATEDLSDWLGRIETTTFPDRRLARFADQNPADFVPIDEPTKTAWESLLALAMAGQWEEAFSEADAIGYEVVDALDTVTGETFHLLREQFVPGELGFIGGGTFAFFQGSGVREDLVIEIPHPVFDSDTLEEGALALTEVRPRVLAIAGTHRNNHMTDSTCDGTFNGGDSFRISDTAHYPDNLLQISHVWLQSNLPDMLTVQFHGFCCPGVPPYDLLTDDCVVSNGFDAVPGPADFTGFWHDAIEAENFLADGVDLTTVAVFGLDTDSLGATTNLQGRVTNGVDPADACDTPASGLSGGFYHLEQDPDVREEPQHILDALGLALDAAADLPSPCELAPAMGCRQAGKSLLSANDKDGDQKDRIKWKWSAGAQTDLADFADAVGGAAIYQLCVYDSSADPQPLLDAGVAGGGTCSGKPCWKAKGTKGLSYKDKLAAADGIAALGLIAGVDGKAKVQAKAQGVELALPALPLTFPVTAQVLIDDGNTVECWQTMFIDPPKKNTPEKLKAKQ